MIRLLLVGVLLTACGGDSPCEKANGKVCEKACACPSSDGMCRIGDTGASFGFENESDCKGFFVGLGCQNPEPGVDYEACAAALDTATCVDVGMGNQALQIPLECKDNSDGGPR